MSSAFNPSDPGDPAYNWAAFDRQVRAASARGLTPIAMVSGAPVWAQAGTDPSSPIGVKPKEYGRFAAAAAARYGGSFGDLPRIQIWQAWNEPNITTFLRPQLVRGRPVAAHNYRALVNAFAASVKRIHNDNLVVAGGLAPFRDSTQDIVDQDEDWGPLSVHARSLVSLGAVASEVCCASEVRCVGDAPLYVRWPDSSCCTAKRCVVGGFTGSTSDFTSGRAGGPHHRRVADALLGDRVQLGLVSTGSECRPSRTPQALGGARALCHVAERCVTCNVVHAC